MEATQIDFAYKHEIVSVIAIFYSTRIKSRQFNQITNHPARNSYYMKSLPLNPVKNKMLFFLHLTINYKLKSTYFPFFFEFTLF